MERYAYAKTPKMKNDNLFVSSEVLVEGTSDSLSAIPSLALIIRFTTSFWIRTARERVIVIYIRIFVYYLT